MPDRSSLARAAAAVLLVVGAACAEPREPIVIAEGMLVLENQSPREWRNVTIIVNDHFSGGAPSLRPGARLTAPLRDFQTGFGQRFDRDRMTVYRVRVTATDSAGQPVTVTWGKP